MHYPHARPATARTPRSGMWGGLGAITIAIGGAGLGAVMSFAAPLLLGFLAIVVAFAGHVRDDRTVMLNQVVAGVAIAISTLVFLAGLAGMLAMT